MKPDWSLGEFEKIAPQLLPAARSAVELAGIRPGWHVVDVGCGSGNAALIAAAPGVSVTGVDPAPRLLDVARADAAAHGLDITFVTGEAASMPLPSGTADLVLSIFGVIFAPDPEAAAAELARITAPGGRMVLTAWQPGGTLHDLNQVGMDALVQANGQSPIPGGKFFPWHERDAVAALLEPFGFSVDVHERELPFTAASPADYWDRQFVRHPFGVAAVPLYEQKGILDDVRSRTIAVLERDNEDPDALRFTAPYVLVEARRPT